MANMLDHFNDVQASIDFIRTSKRHIIESRALTQDTITLAGHVSQRAKVAVRLMRDMRTTITHEPFSAGEKLWYLTKLIQLEGRLTHCIDQCMEAITYVAGVDYAN
jgi:hypothetical protein